MLLSVISFFAFFLLVTGFATKATSQTLSGGLRGGPDIVIKDLGLTEDLDLSILLSNAGQTDLRKGVKLGIQIFVNQRKVSEFDHYVSGALKAGSGNRYNLEPPYHIGLSGTARVRTSITPKRASNDVQPANNVMERTFVIFPLKMGPRDKQNFSFSLIPPQSREGHEAERIKLEVRLDGEGRVALSVKKPGGGLRGPNVSGKTPLRAEVPLRFEIGQKEGMWKVSVSNRLNKKVEGHLIIQHP